MCFGLGPPSKHPCGPRQHPRLELALESPLPIPSLPPAQTPLYNHPLTAIEAWLAVLGAVQQPGRPCFWRLRHGGWSADLELGVEEVTVVWQPGSASDGSATASARRQFPYGLSRADVEAAILAGP